jgi:hypothetical protein
MRTMKPGKRQTVEQILNGLSRAQVLQALATVQRRRAQTMCCNVSCLTSWPV